MTNIPDTGEGVTNVSLFILRTENILKLNNSIFRQIFFITKNKFSNYHIPRLASEKAKTKKVLLQKSVFFVFNLSTLRQDKPVG